MGTCCCSTRMVWTTGVHMMSGTTMLINVAFLVPQQSRPCQPLMVVLWLHIKKVEQTQCQIRLWISNFTADSSVETHRKESKRNGTAQEGNNLLSSCSGGKLCMLKLYPEPTLCKPLLCPLCCFWFLVLSDFPNEPPATGVVTFAGYVSESQGATQDLPCSSKGTGWSRSFGTSFQGG